MFEAGDVILAHVPFTDGEGIKIRPAVVLFEEHDNVIVAGITSNQKMRGIPLLKSEGMPMDSVIKPNYIFTISPIMVKKRLIRLSKEKAKLVHGELVARLRHLVY